MNNSGKGRLIAAGISPKEQTPLKKVYACKVQRGYYQPKSDNTSVEGQIHRRPPEPWIQLRGYWLDHVGFAVDTQLTVEVTDSCITLRPILPTNLRD